MISLEIFCGDEELVDIMRKEGIVEPCLSPIQLGAASPPMPVDALSVSEAIK